MSTVKNVTLGIASMTPVAAIVLFIWIALSFERMSDEALTIAWVVFVSLFVIGRFVKAYFNSMVAHGEVAPSAQKYWKEKARFMGPLASAIFWWRAMRGSESPAVIGDHVSSSFRDPSD